MSEGEPPAQNPLDHAKLLASRGQLALGRELCEGILRRDPLDAEAYFLLAGIYQEMGDAAQAERALQRCIYLTPDAALPHFVLGTLLLRERKLWRARRCFETVAHLLRQMPDDTALPDGDGLTAGHLAGMARTALAMVTTTTRRSVRPRPAAFEDSRQGGARMR